MKANFVIFFITLNLFGCVVGHGDYKRYLDMSVGNNIKQHMPHDGSESGQLIRSDYLMGGDGLTHMTILGNGKIRYHFSAQEVLSNYSIKDYVGKCLVYYDTDPDSHIILGWGFDEGGNPLSCRTWP